MDGLLVDQVALITGAASGMGRATARTFARHGARLVLVDRDEPRLREVGEELGDVAVTLSADVADRRFAEAAVGRARERFGRLDIVVSNAGVHGSGATALERWDESLSANMTPSYALALAALPELQQSEAGAIVLVSSIAGPIVGFASAHYDAAKAGLVGLARHLASAWGQHGIRVNAVCPGFIDTPFIGASWDGERLAAVRRDVALGRLGTAEEMADVILFLGSKMSSYVTGATLVADGGWTIHYAKY